MFFVAQSRKTRLGGEIQKARRGCRRFGVTILV
jgi:hypothetical protein